MRIMSSRYDHLQWAIEGYQKSNIPLVGYGGYEESSFHVAGGGLDNIGTFYAIPLLQRVTGLSLDNSINLFYAVSILLPLFIGLWGMFRIAKSTFARCYIAASYCYFAYHMWLIGDTYVYTANVVIAIIPWIIYCYRSRCKDRSWVFLLFSAGLFCSAAAYMRSHAGIGVLLFIIVILLCNKYWTWAKKATMALVLAIGIIIPILFFSAIRSQSESYIISQNPNYQLSSQGIVFWHTVYIGLGFMGNEWGMHYSDLVGLERAKQIAPQVKYLSPEYLQIMKQETLNMLKNHRRFVFDNLYAKFAFLVLYFVIYANLGLVKAWLRKKDAIIETAFWGGIAYNGLYGLLIIPDPKYILGFTAFAVVYAAYNMQNAEWADYRTKIFFWKHA